MGNTVVTAKYNAYAIQGKPVSVSSPNNDDELTFDAATQSWVPAPEIPIGNLPWTEVTGASANMAVNNGYIANRATLVTLTLPATAAKGSLIRIAGKGAGGWKVAQNAGQSIIAQADGNAISTTVGVTGHLDSTALKDAVDLLCTVADTEFTRINIEGSPTLS